MNNVDEARQDAAGVEVLARDLDGAPGVPRVVGVDGVDAGQRFVGRREGEQPLARRQVRGPARVLHERRDVPPPGSTRFDR